jgi:hypothetical protein
MCSCGLIPAAQDFSSGYFQSSPTTPLPPEAARPIVFRASPGSPRKGLCRWGGGRTPEPPHVGSCPRQEPPAAHARTVPPCTYLRCPTENAAPEWRRTSFVTPHSSSCPRNQNLAGGLLLPRHEPPLAHRLVVYSYSGVLNPPGWPLSPEGPCFHRRR